MKKKTNEIPDSKRTPPAPIPANSAEDTAANVLTAIRQLEPEAQNEVVLIVLKELAIDRHNAVRQLNEAADRAGKNMNVFMYNAVGLEKIMAEKIERKG
jgi:hypothetical protein